MNKLSNRQEHQAPDTPALPTTTILATVFDGDDLLENHAVQFRGERITAVLHENELSATIGKYVELKDEVLIPGYIDIQVNGGGGVLFNDAPEPATIATIGAAHRRFGTTGFLPTLISDTPEIMRRGIDAVEQAILENVPGVLGIHLEGPYLNEIRAGVHNPAHFRRLDEEGLRLVTSLTQGITVLTLAPELTCPELIGKLTDKGVIVSAGHSAANYDQARSAISAGLRGFTHLFNGMEPFKSRAPGTVGAALAIDDAWFGIIADGYHVHPASFRIAVRAKRRGGALLVTDAMPTVGTDQTQFELFGKTIQIESGRCTTSAGGLAGSSLDMNTAVLNASEFANIDWLEAVRMATRYPAQALGLDNELGRIKPSYRANFISVDSDRRVAKVWIDGVQHFGDSDLK